DHGGDVVAERGLERCDIVPRADREIVGRVRILTRSARRRDRLAWNADVDVVEPAVIVAEELDDAVAARGGPRDPQRRVHRLAAGAVEDAELGGGHGAAHRFGELDLKPMTRSVPEARAQLPLHGCEHWLGRVAE